jgi:hypothetical protein
MKRKKSIYLNFRENMLTYTKCVFDMADEITKTPNASAAVCDSFPLAYFSSKSVGIEFLWHIKYISAS